VWSDDPPHARRNWEALQMNRTVSAHFWSSRPAGAKGDICLRNMKSMCGRSDIPNGCICPTIGRTTLIKLSRFAWIKIRKVLILRLIPRSRSLLAIGVAVAQLGEHYFRNLGVEGSNRFCSFWDVLTGLPASPLHGTDRATQKKTFRREVTHVQVRCPG